MSDGLRERQSNIKLFMGVAGLVAMTATHFKPEIDQAKAVVKETIVQAVSGKPASASTQTLTVK